MTYIPSFGNDTPRKGAYGGHWNHIRAVNNYQNGTMLFIDGTLIKACFDLFQLIDQSIVNMF